MKWKRIPKEHATQPTSGNYRDWKDIIASEGFRQCVYCAIHESAFGGIRNFHVEHYRPKSKFANLINDIFNLFYACAICNIFKGDDWPDEPHTDHLLICYPNPSEVDYETLFNVDVLTGLVSGKFTASRYLVEQLHLNRHQLVLERRTFFIYEQIAQTIETLVGLAEELNQIRGEKPKQYLFSVVRLLGDINRLKDAMRSIGPYTSDQTR